MGCPPSPFEGGDEAIHQRPLGAVASLLPSASADGRSSDDVIAF